MTLFETLVICLTILSVIVIPLFVVGFKVISHMTRMTSRLDELSSAMTVLVEDKNKVHLELSQQMHEDRQATNERLTWLERNAWPEKRNKGKW